MDIYIYSLHESLNNSSSGRNLTLPTPGPWNPARFLALWEKPSEKRKETRFLFAKGKGSAYSLGL